MTRGLDLLDASLAPGSWLTWEDGRLSRGRHHDLRFEPGTHYPAQARTSLEAGRFRALVDPDLFPAHAAHFATEARLSRRSGMEPDYRSDRVGVRPARELDARE